MKNMGLNENVEYGILYKKLYKKNFDSWKAVGESVSLSGIFDKLKNFLDGITLLRKQAQ